MAAVCSPGTFLNGHKLPTAQHGALCRSPLNVAISMNEYTSNFEMQNDLALFKGQPYAWKTSRGLRTISDYGGLWVRLNGRSGPKAASQVRFSVRNVSGGS